MNSLQEEVRRLQGERDEARAEVERLRAATERVRALHPRGEPRNHYPFVSECEACEQLWPCWTLRALGDKSDMETA